MGYSRSPITVHRREALVRPLLSGDDEVFWPASFQDAPRICRQLYECLSVARAYPREFPKLALASDQYILRVEANGVRAIKRNRCTPHDPKAVAAPLPTVTTSAEVIQAWINRPEGSEAPLRFLDGGITQRDLAELNLFASNTGCRLSLENGVVVLQVVSS